jgi:uncharacterized membrane protein
MTTVICPKCGTENPYGAVNCEKCRIILKLALDYAEVNEPVEQHQQESLAAHKIEDNLLDLPPSAEKLRKLAKDGVLTAEALERALKITNDRPGTAGWERFLNILLLVLGAGFSISGVFFFFAFNWADMHRFFKLGLLEFAMLVAVGLAFWRGLDRLSGKIALGAAGLIIGALLAVYGQIYQTGADSYELFLGWALLITGWVLISKFIPLWFVWVILFDLSLVFYWIQIVGNQNSMLYLWVFLLNGSAILVWEVIHARGIDWLKSRWAPRLLSLLVFVSLVIPTIILIFSSEIGLEQDPLLFLMLFLFIGTSAAVLYVYSQKILDLFMLTICAFSLIIAFNSLVVNILDILDEFLFFCLSGLFIGQAALVVTWLRQVSKSWEAREL